MNTSSGTASIVTGTATAVGNSATTTVTQGWTGTVNGLGVMYIVQQSVVLNLGVALANTGGNAAIGNASQNSAGVLQIQVGWTNPGSVTSMVAVASNSSDGIARITTGQATATGNSATTNVVQVVTILGNGTGAPFVLVQQGFVHNIGMALANSGDNVAIGNQSTNDAEVVQVGTEGEGGVLSATASNESNGTAVIDTGVPGETTPTPTPTPGPVPNPTAPVSPVDVPPASVEGLQVTPAVEASGTLPYTGSDHTRDAAAAGMLLLLAGLGLERRSRRSTTR
jgi:LPXTG-motif cell wall-anchored protein